jgi:colanic acid/amylovoran biosynthesis glycosyltransferase
MDASMQLAVFTNKFPAEVSTFFARDMRALIDAGIDLDIFAFYPLEPDLWRYVPQILAEDVLPRNRVRHISLTESFRYALRSIEKLRIFFKNALPICRSAAHFGPSQLTKTVYVLFKALAWAQQCNRSYDHIVAYWGNYSATCAYLFHRLTDPSIPFSMFLHAGMDLYEGQVYIREKLLYTDKIIVVSDFNREFLQRNYNDIFPQISEKIHKYCLGIDLAEFKYEAHGRQSRKILAVGALNHYKGFDYLLRAAHLLSNRGLHCEVDIVGDGKELKFLRKLASELKIQQQVRFAGWLIPDEVRKEMSRATILVHPSNGLGDNMPTVIKEAMAIGLPVIASEVAGIPELLDHGRCGTLVPTGNVEALANAMETLLMDSELCRTYAESARKDAEERFDLWRNGRRLAEILRSTTRLDFQPWMDTDKKLTKSPEGTKRK